MKETNNGLICTMQEAYCDSICTMTDASKDSIRIIRYANKRFSLLNMDWVSTA